MKPRKEKTGDEKANEATGRIIQTVAAAAASFKQKIACVQVLAMIDKVKS